MKIRSVKKFIRSIIMVLLVIIGLSLLLSKGTYSHAEKQYKTIYISEGDTLWEIAKTAQVDNQYYKNKDVRYIISDLVKINNLKNSNININQKLLIPVL